MLIEFMRNELEARCKANPKYSLRAFASALSMDSSTLSALLAGKRKLTPKAEKKILNRLEVPAHLRERLLSSQPPARAAEFHVLKTTTFESLAGWEHYAILCALELPKLVKTARSLATHLGLSSGETIAALSRLEQAELIAKDSKGVYSPILGARLSSGSEVPSHAIKRQNREYIQKALESQEQDPLDIRDITGMTLTLSKKKIPQVKKLIQEFRRSLADYLSKDLTPDQVYRLNVQFFPLSKKEIRK